MQRSVGRDLQSLFTAACPGYVRCVQSSNLTRLFCLLTHFFFSSSLLLSQKKKINPQVGSSVSLNSESQAEATFNDKITALYYAHRESLTLRNVGVLCLYRGA